MKCKILVLILFLNLISCKKSEENQSVGSCKIKKEESKRSKNPEINLDAFLISKGQIGKVKIGMNLNQANMFLRGMTKKEIEAYDFGYGGGGKAYLYSICNEPILALIPNFQTGKIIAIIAISKDLKTDNGLTPNSTIKDVLRVYPKMKIAQDEMTNDELMFETVNNWSFVFKTNQNNKIGEYSDMEMYSVPKRLDAKMDYMEID